MNKKLSPKAFFLSQIVILVIGISLIIGAANLFQNKQPQSVEGLSTELPVVSAPASFNLMLDNPDDNSLVYDKGLIISGTTMPNASVIISNNSDDVGLQADQNGDFSQVITIPTGLSHIIVSAFDTSGNSKSVDRTVYYSEEKI